MNSELQNMLDNKLYFSADPELKAMRMRARKLVKQYNDSEPDEPEVRNNLLAQLLGKMGKNCEIEPDFRCDYGTFIELGDNVFINFGCVILDCNYVRIGSNVMFASKVQLLCAYHPLDADERNSGYEFGAPISIGDNVWLGAGVIVNPGITIGANSVIGSGSVVTKSIEPYSVAYGNPCRVARTLSNKQDS
jgi:maltose O-acetyltransferase